METGLHLSVKVLTKLNVFDGHRVLMVNINENITNGDIKNLIFLLSRTLPREKMDKVKVSWRNYLE